MFIIVNSTYVFEPYEIEAERTFLENNPDAMLVSRTTKGNAYLISCNYSSIADMNAGGKE